MQDNAYKKLEKSAMRMLASCEHSRFNLREKLLKRSSEKHQIEILLDQLEADNYLSDERFTEVFINSHRNKGKGPSRILKELRQQQISIDLISLYLDVEDTQWIDLAAEVRNKKFGSILPDIYAEKMKQARFLEYRGFTNTQIFSVLG